MRGHGDARRKGNVVRPPGLQHSRLLAASLRRALSDLTEPWNEEDYGWEFLGNRRPERPSGMSLPLEDAERPKAKIACQGLTATTQDAT